MNGEGSEDPIWEFIGEAPGKDEDEKGIPFWGESGLLLREAIEEIGINPKKCRFTNVVRCRPPDNDLKKWPNAAEHCRPHILRELRATMPKVVILLGNTATKSLLNKTGILKLHGEVIDIGRWKYVCCFHPSYLLRNNTPSVRKSFLSALRIAKDAGMPKKISKHSSVEHILVRDKKTLQEVHDHLKKQKLLATDIEGSTLSPYSRVRTARLGCVGWAWDDRHAVCYPIHLKNVDVGVRVKPEMFLESMKEIWEDENIRHVCHAGKYDYTYPAVLHDIWMGGKANCGYYSDTYHMSYVLNERPGGHGLKDWALVLGMGGYEQPLRQYQLQFPEADPGRGGNMLKVPLSLLAPYNMNDCIATWKLFFLLRHRLKKQNLWERPYKFPQLWHNWTAAMMEIHGIRVNKDRNTELDGIYRKRYEKGDQEIHEFSEILRLQRRHDKKLLKEVMIRVLSYKKPVPDVHKKVMELFNNIPKEKREVNLDSPETKRTLLFKIMKYKPIAYTNNVKNPLPSVKREYVEEMYKKQPHKLLKKIIRQGEISTSLSKYITPVKNWIGTDGRTHTNYNPAGQVTGRVPSENPNHENLPKHGTNAMELRSQFTSSGDDYFILEQDSKQMEMRLFADRAQDDIMIEEFNQGKDPHAMGAMAGFEISEEKWAALKDAVRKELRFAAKSAVSFGLLYGRGAPALAEDFGKSLRWAEKFISRYFGKYDDCLEYRQDRERYIKKHKIVFSHFFRPRRLPEVDSENPAQVAEAVRNGINSPIQGDCSDVTWVALHRIEEWLKKYRLKSKVVRSRAIIAVHDASYIDTYYKELDDVMEKQHKFMTDRDFIHKMTGWYCTVPFDTDCSIGPDLGHMEELKHGGSAGEFIVPSTYK